MKIKKMKKNKEYKRAIKKIRREARKIVKNKKKKYQFVRKTKTTKLVPRLVVKHFNETGTILSTKEALKLLEDFLRGHNEARLKFKKIGLKK